MTPHSLTYNLYLQTETPYPAERSLVRECNYLHIFLPQEILSSLTQMRT